MIVREADARFRGEDTAHPGGGGAARPGRGRVMMNRRSDDRREKSLRRMDDRPHNAPGRTS